MQLMIRKEACRTMRSRSGRRKGDETDDDEEDEEEDDDDDSLLDEDAPDADEVMQVPNVNVTSLCALVFHASRTTNRHLRPPPARP